MDSPDERGDVDVDDVAVLEPAGVRDAVTDALVDRGAQRLRETLVTERRRVGTVVAEEVVADPVDLVGRDTRLDDRGGFTHGLRGEPARDAHLLDDLRWLHVRARERGRERLADVLRSLDRSGHLA